MVSRSKKTEILLMDQYMQEAEALSQDLFALYHRLWELEDQYPLQERNVEQAKEINTAVTEINEKADKLRGCQERLVKLDPQAPKKNPELFIAALIEAIKALFAMEEDLYNEKVKSIKEKSSIQANKDLPKMYEKEKVLEHYLKIAEERKSDQTLEIRYDLNQLKKDIKIAEGKVKAEKRKEPNVKDLKKMYEKKDVLEHYLKIAEESKSDQVSTIKRDLLQLNENIKAVEGKLDVQQRKKLEEIKNYQSSVREAVQGLRDRRKALVHRVLGSQKERESFFKKRNKIRKTKKTEAPKAPLGSPTGKEAKLKIRSGQKSHDHLLKTKEKALKSFVKAQSEYRSAKKDFNQAKEGSPGYKKALKRFNKAQKAYDLSREKLNNVFPGSGRLRMEPPVQKNISESDPGIEYDI